MRGRSADLCGGALLLVVVDEVDAASRVVRVAVERLAVLRGQNTLASCDWAACVLCPPPARPGIQIQIQIHTLYLYLYLEPPFFHR